ncbi:MAG: NAD+ synthase [Planctomycetota bacterium]|nr:NAD+ synthase [Planctomycetota bacterium]
MKLPNLRLALAQLNPRVGDLKGNLAAARRAVDTARRDGAALVVFPELAVTGYPPKDLLDKPAFVDAVEAAARAWAGLSAGGPALLFGSVVRTRDGPGKGLYNVAHLARDGRIVGTQAKSLLPSYDVFDEDRHFRPPRAVEPLAFGSLRLGVTVCEDIWNDKTYWAERLYADDPLERVAAAGADLFINLSASPFALGKPAIRREMLAHAARRHGRALVYVNQVGGNDDVLYDGRSLVLDAAGRVLAELRAFGEEVRTVELAALAPFEPPAREEERELFDALAMGLRDYAGKCGFRQAVLGLSGGIDSALTAALAVEALGRENVLGLAMPSRYSSAHSRGDAQALAENLGLELRTLPIEPVFSAYLETLAPHFAGRAPDVAEENLQARIRGALLMAFSNKFGRLLLTTGNKSEVAVGYCTLYGDTCGGLAVLSDLFKTKVYALARWYNAFKGREVIPRGTLEKAPSAELAPGQKDADSLPPYEVLDAILAGYIEETWEVDRLATALQFDRGLIAAIVRRVDRNEYKRKQLPPGLRVTKKAFGSGRVMPLAQGWE